MGEPCGGSKDLGAAWDGGTLAGQSGEIGAVSGGSPERGPADQLGQVLLLMTARVPSDPSQLLAPRTWGLNGDKV